MPLRPGTLPAPRPPPFSGSCISDRVKATDSWVQGLESPVSPKGECFQMFLIHLFRILGTKSFEMLSVLVVIMLKVLKLTFKIVEPNLIIIEKITEKITKNITKLSHKKHSCY